MKNIILLLAVSMGLLSAADGPRLVYTKKFPGSTPAYVSISVDRNGSVAYKEVADEDPDTFTIEPDAVQAMFQLSDQLNHFQGKLDSGLKVAFMGEKTLRWENGAEGSESKFNYSLDENARLLHDWFERITESETLAIQLKRAIKYDKLGVNDAVLRIQASWERKRLVGLEQLVPMLQRVSDNEAFLHMARDRAGSLVQTFKTALQAQAAPQPAKASNP